MRTQVQTRSVRAHPLEQLLVGHPQLLREQTIHVLFEASKVAGPLRGLGELDVLVTLPFHRMEQQDAVVRDQAARASRQRPQRGRRTLARHDAR